MKKILFLLALLTSTSSFSKIYDTVDVVYLDFGESYVDVIEVDGSEIIEGFSCGKFKRSKDQKGALVFVEEIEVNTGVKYKEKIIFCNKAITLDQTKIGKIFNLFN